MSFEYSTWAIRHYRGAGCTEFKILIALGDWADEFGVCWPSYGTIAKAVERNRDTVIKSVKLIEQEGQIIVIRPEIAGQSNHNYYVVVKDRTIEQITEVLRSSDILAGKVKDPEGVARECFVRRGEIEEEPSQPDQSIGEWAREHQGSDWELPPADLQRKVLFAGQFPLPQTWDPTEVLRIQQLVESNEMRTGKLKDIHRQLMTYLLYVTSWDLPTRKEAKDWARTFDEHVEKYGDPLYIAELYEVSWGVLWRNKQERGITLPQRPETLSKTMSDRSHMVKSSSSSPDILSKSPEELERMLFGGE